MKILIKYYELRSDHILATPEYDREEIVDVKNYRALQEYVTSKKDAWGHKFKRDKSFGFDFISNCGAVKIEQYKQPKIKRI